MSTSASHQRTARQPYPVEHSAPPTTQKQPSAPKQSANGPREPYDLVTVPARQGIEAVDILRLRTGVGPVLHDSCGGTLGFLVPGGTAKHWNLPGSACTGTFREVREGRPPVSDAGWLLPPTGAVPYTDPRLLKLALGEAAVTLEAADRL